MQRGRNLRVAAPLAFQYTEDMALHVVTHSRWVAEELSDNSSGTKIKHSLGISLPKFEVGDSVWAPMEWMCLAQQSCVGLSLTAPPDDFLLGLSDVFLRRDIKLITFEELSFEDPDSHTYLKPANSKIEKIPCLYLKNREHSARILEAGVPAESQQKFLVSNIKLPFVEEYRVYVLDGKAFSSSLYLSHTPDGEVLWYDNMEAEQKSRRDSMRFAQTVLDSLGQIPCRGFTLDVALLDNGTWAVVEANPAWSSAFYGNDIDVVVKCIEASSKFESVWVPDEHLAQVTSRKRNLRY